MVENVTKFHLQFERVPPFRDSVAKFGDSVPFLTGNGFPTWQLESLAELLPVTHDGATDESGEFATRPSLFLPEVPECVIVLFKRMPAPRQMRYAADDGGSSTTVDERVGIVCVDAIVLPRAVGKTQFLDVLSRTTANCRRTAHPCRGVCQYQLRYLRWRRLRK